MLNHTLRCFLFLLNCSTHYSSTYYLLLHLGYSAYFLSPTFWITRFLRGLSSTYFLRYLDNSTNYLYVDLSSTPSWITLHSFDACCVSLLLHLHHSRLLGPSSTHSGYHLLHDLPRFLTINPFHPRLFSHVSAKLSKQ